MAKEMTREEKLWTMTGTTLLGVAEGLGLNVNKNTLKQGKEKLIAKILEAEKKLENGANTAENEANTDAWEQEANAEHATREEQQAKNDKEAEDTINKPKRRGRTRDSKPATESKTETKTKEKIETKAEEKTTNRGNLKLKELTYKGKTQTIRAWADELQMPWATLYDRVNRNGWSVEDAIEIPLGQRRK